MNWPHSPKHWAFGPGVYIVTAGTYLKAAHLHSPERRDFFLESLFKGAVEFGWELRAWAILSNHYHFVGSASEKSGPLKRFLGKLHMTTAKQLNFWDAQPGRKVWFQYWDTRITFEKSYLARLHYVHCNPVFHKAADLAQDYRWSSARWFTQNANPSFVETVTSFKVDLVNVPDDF